MDLIDDGVREAAVCLVWVEDVPLYEQAVCLVRVDLGDLRSQQLCEQGDFRLCFGVLPAGLLGMFAIVTEQFRGKSKALNN